MTDEKIDSHSSALAQECRRRLKKSLADIYGNIANNGNGPPEKGTGTEQTALILSGGVDTTAILEAAAEIGMTFAACITVVIGDEPPDEKFAMCGAKLHNYTDVHHIVRMTSDDLVETHLPRTIKLLETWGGMTLRNSLVISAAFQEAQRLGMKHVVVGDGADELFGGYSFMWGNEDNVAEWKKKRDSMCRQWTFATPQLAASFGLSAHGPFMGDEYVEWALNSTVRSDCIGERPIKLVLDGESVMHKVGKVVLREAFETCASWRRKDPIEVGSGATVIGKDAFWAEKLPDDEFEKEKEKLREEEGIIINTKENMINFRIYIETFGGIVHSTKKRLDKGEGCVGCCFELGEKENFCRVCEAWPAQRSGLVE